MTLSSNEKKILVFLGPPGSGKGTQAKRLSAEIGLPHISTGDLFRENMKQETDLGKKAKEYINEGHLVPDELVLAMLFDRVSKPDCQKGYILDGFPRRITQAKALQERQPKDEQLIALNLQVSDSTVIERITGRRVCRSCGHMQHLKFNPPQVEGVCDKCNGELFQRTDDGKEIVVERVKVYHEETEPLIAFYDNLGWLININGEKNPNQVFTDLLSALK